jgi:acyl-CoA thioester hydrolase
MLRTEREAKTRLRYRLTKVKMDSSNSTPDTIFSLPVRVYYQDTDAGGVVYHSTYLDFLERARYEWLRELGFDIHSLIQTYKVIFMIRSLDIEYFKPALLDDLLQVGVRPVELGRSRITLAQQVLRDSTVLARATVHAVCVGAESLKPVSVPAPLRHRMGHKIGMRP